MEDEELDSLRTQYHQSVPEKLRLLNELIAALHASSSKEDLKALKDFVHKLVGSSGVYGFAQASTACKEFDLFLADKIAKQELKINWQQHCKPYLDNIYASF